MLNNLNKNRHNTAFFRYLVPVFLGILMLLSSTVILREIAYSALLLLLTIIFCFKAVRTLPKTGFDFFNPGLLFLFYGTAIILPIAVISMWDHSLVQSKYKLIGHEELASKTLYAYAFFFLTFTFSYVTLSPKDIKNQSIVSFEPTISKNWLVLAGAFLFIDITLRFAMGVLRINPWQEGTQVLSRAVNSVGLFIGQIHNKIVLLENISIIIAIGAFVASCQSLHKARRALFLCLLVVFVPFYVLTTERGFILVLGIGAAAYADKVKWKGRLFDRRLLISVIVLGFAFNILTGIIESRVIYGNANLDRKLQPINVLTLGGGTASVWVTSQVISWTENGDIPFQYGRTYWEAIKSILPRQIVGRTMPSLSYWFAYELVPFRADSGVAYGFSPVAEGYLNAGMIGVVLYGLVIGGLAALVQSFSVRRRFGLLNIFLYVTLTAGFHIIHHRGFMWILSKFQWTILGTILLFYIMKTISGVSRSDKTFYGKKAYSISYQ